MRMAPLDRSALERVLQPFGQGRLLPREAYTSEEVLHWEREHFFSGAWVYAGRADGLASVGDQRAIRVGKDGILLVRDAEDRVRGFFNSCRHRAHELLQVGECTNERSLRCPYHGWTYGLDGALHAAVRGSHASGFDPRAEGLVPARVQVWQGFVFVNPDGDAPSLEGWLSDLVELTTPYPLERLRVARSHSYELAANWKIAVENYHECYHCPRIHPELCRLSHPDSGATYERAGAWVGGSMELGPGIDTMALDGKSRGVSFPGLSAAQEREVSYYGLFPNLLLSIHPDYVMTHRLEPLSPTRTFIECQWLFAPESFAAPGFDPAYAVDFWDLTNKQDWAAVESVQRGIESRGYVPGTLTPREDAVYQFVTGVARGYLEGRFAPGRRAPTHSRG
jgi:glycine betaine catabolism A